MLSIILQEKKMSIYKCSKLSGIPYSTLSDLVRGKTSIRKCNAEILFALAETLDVSVETIYNLSLSEEFESFKSIIKHNLKRLGDIGFIKDVYASDEISKYWNIGEHAKSLYLLAAVDYLSRINNLPLASDYNDIRQHKLKSPALPKSFRLMTQLENSKQVVGQSLNSAIPEFKRFNIIEGDLKDVF